jgi:ATP-binding cassette subfamily B protein
MISPLSLLGEGARGCGGNTEELNGYLLRTYLRGQWPKVGVLALLLAGDVALQFAQPLIVRRCLDAATGGGDPAGLGRITLLFLGVAVLTQVVAVALTYAA